MKIHVKFFENSLRHLPAWGVRKLSSLPSLSFVRNSLFDNPWNLSACLHLRLSKERQSVLPPCVFSIPIYFADEKNWQITTKYLTLVFPLRTCRLRILVEKPRTHNRKLWHHFPHLSFFPAANYWSKFSRRPRRNLILDLVAWSVWRVGWWDRVYQDASYTIKWQEQKSTSPKFVHLRNLS